LNPKDGRFRKVYYFVLLILTSVIYSLSQAQNMFFHLLPGFGTPFTWVGLGSDANWTTAENWNTNAVPGLGDTATFDNTCLSNCNPTINVSISLKGVNIKDTYSGTITQGSGNTMVIGTSGWAQAGGTFNGSDSNITFSASTLKLTGIATFNSTTAETYFDQTQATSVNTISADAGTTLIFPDNSTQHFRLQANCGGIVYGISSPQKISFYDVVTETFNVGCGSAGFGNATGTIEIRNDMSHISGGGLPILFQGTIELFGNLLMASASNNGETWISKGTVSKTFTGPGGIGNFILSKTGGAAFTPSTPSQTFYMGSLRIQSGEFTFPQTMNLIWKGSSGTFFKVDPGTTVNVPVDSTVNIDSQGNCGTRNRNFDTNGIFNFQYLSISGSYTGCGASDLTVSGGSSLVVKKDFTLGDSFSANFDITVEGSLINTTQSSGSMALTLTTGSSATASVSAAGVVSGTVSVSKPLGTVTASSNLTFNNTGQDMNISNGIVDLAGRNLTVNDVLTVGSNGKLICNGGSVVANSWSIAGEVSCGTSIGITWTGLAGDHLWSTASNWTNNTVPGATDVAIFNGMCAGVNCNAQIDSNLSVRGIVLQSAYNGTLTQNVSRTLTVGAAGFTQAGGNFMGGDGAMNFDGAFQLTGGSYTATSGTWTHAGSTFEISGSSIFNHNSGFLKFSLNASQNLITGSVEYNNVELNSTGWASKNLQAGSMTIVGDLTLSGYSGCYSYCTVDNGIINLKGNLIVLNDGMWGTAEIKINGNSNQSVDASLASVNSVVPKLEIASSGGVVTLIGSIRTAYDYIYTSGSLDPGTSNLIFMGSQNIQPGPTTYYNVDLSATGWQTKNLLGGTLKVGNLLTLSAYAGCGRWCATNNGTIELYGNLNATLSGMTGTALLKVMGNGNQVLTGVYGAQIFATEIASTGGAVTLSGNLYFVKSYLYTAGVIDAATSTVSFDSNISINPGSGIFYNNVKLDGYTTTINLTGTLNVNGILTMGGTSSSPRAAINGGVVNVFGSANFVSLGFTGTTEIKIIGSVNQTLTGVASASIPNLEIASTGGTVTFSGTIFAINSYKVTSGVINAGTSTLYLSNVSDLSPDIQTYNNVTIDGYTSVTTLTGTFNINGTLLVGGTSSSPPIYINSGLINAAGNLSFVNSGALGTTVINMMGATNSTLNSGNGSNGNLSSTLIVAKTGGASVLLAAAGFFSTAGRDFTVTSGTLDLASYDLTINDVLTVDPGATVRCNGGEFTAGNVANSGTINCPGYLGYDFNWTGAALDGNWNTPGNWQLGSVPGGTDLAAFMDSACGANCNANINTPIVVRGIRLLSTYSGTITQSVSQTVTWGAKGWGQSAGTFIGSDAAITITGQFRLSGGTYTATSGTTNLRETIISGTPTFNHNNGHWIWTNSSAISSVSSVHFNDVTFSGHAMGYNLGGSTMRVDGDLVFADTSSLTNLGRVNNGTIDVYGNVSNSGYGKNGTANVRVMGNPLGQTINGVNTGYFPAMTINAGANNVTFSGDLKFVDDFNMVSVGTLTVAGSTIYFTNRAGGSSQTIVPGTVNYNDVVIYGHNTNYNFSGGTLNVGGTLTLGDTGSWANLRSINSGTLLAFGDVIVTDFGSNGTANIEMAGSAPASLNMSATGFFPRGTVVLNKTGGAVIQFMSNVQFNGVGTQNLTINNGTSVDMNGYNLTVGNNIINNGVINRGTSPTCGVISQGGTFSGNAPLCL
jgi:hypothetical protein